MRAIASASVATSSAAPASPAGQQAFGLADARQRDVPVDPRVVGQLEAQVLAPVDPFTPDGRAHAREQRGERRVRVHRGLVVPDRLDQLAAADGAVALDHEAGEQQPALAAGQQRVDALPAEFGRQRAAQLHAVLRQRFHRRLRSTRRAISAARAPAIAALVWWFISGLLGVVERTVPERRCSPAARPLQPRYSDCNTRKMSAFGPPANALLPWRLASPQRWSSAYSVRLKSSDRPVL